MQTEFFFKGKVVHTDEQERIYVALYDPEQVEEFYIDHQKKFWSDRNEAPEDLFPVIIEQQEVDYLSGKKLTLAKLFQSHIVLMKSENKSKISVLELGCANGPTLRHLKKVAPDIEVQFTGFELTPFLVDDLIKRYPGAKAYVGGAEEMIDMAPAELGAEVFDIFLASLVLSQIPPYRILDVFKHVSKNCDQIMIFDFLINIDGVLSSEYPVLFKHIPDSPHFVFAHPYRELLREAGFEIEQIRYSNDNNDVVDTVSEFGAILARNLNSKASF